jgi:hypothetical protein
VRNITTSFGENAGKIWHVLHEKGSISKEKLLEFTQLNESEFHGAVGWLARENKIFEGDHYTLDETNLASKIGSNAGKVWKVLDIWGEIDISTLKRLAGIDEHDVYSALGWLAREDKIWVDEQQKYLLK